MLRAPGAALLRRLLVPVVVQPEAAASRHLKWLQWPPRLCWARLRLRLVRTVGAMLELVAASFRRAAAFGRLCGPLGRRPCMQGCSLDYFTLLLVVLPVSVVLLLAALMI
jgi:hypothetical protein